METEKKKTRKPFETRVRVIDSRAADLSSLRRMVRQNPAQAYREMQDRIHNRGMRWRDVGSLQGLFDACWDRDRGGAVMVKHRAPVMGRQRLITSGMFPLLSGELTSVGITEAYMSVPDPTLDLVTEMEDVKDWTHVPEILPKNAGSTEAEGVKEGDAYPLVGAGERRYSIGSFNDGLRLAITEKMIRQNDIPGVIERVNFIGTTLMKRKIRRTLWIIMDYDGSKASPAAPYALIKDGVNTTLYTTTANSPGTETPSGTELQNRALVDSDSLDAAREHLAGYVDHQGFPVEIEELVILAPEAKRSNLMQVLTSEKIPGEFNTMNQWGPSGRFRVKAVITQWLDNTISSSAWAMGDFKRQFRRKTASEFRNVTLGREGQAYLERDIAFQARASEDVKTNAVRFNGVVRCLASTTAPADES